MARQSSGSLASPQMAAAQQTPQRQVCRGSRSLYFLQILHVLAGAWVFQMPLWTVLSCTQEQEHTFMQIREWLHGDGFRVSPSAQCPVRMQPSPQQRLASPLPAPGSGRGPASPAVSAGLHPAATTAQQQAAALRHQQAQQVRCPT